MHEPGPLHPGSTKWGYKETLSRLQKARHAPLGGDRGWNTLCCWDDLLDPLVPAALIVDRRGEAYQAEDPPCAHPADVIALQAESTTEWTARTSRAISATMCCAKLHPSWGTENWRQLCKFYMHWKTGNSPCSGEYTPWRTRCRRGSSHHGAQRGGAGGEKGGSSTRREKRCRKWIPLHGVNQEDMAALETDSFLNDLDEVAMLPTLPLPGEAPQMPQCRGRCEKRCRRCRLHDPPVRETRDRDSSPGSRRRRRLHAVLFDLHGPI